ncbi:MAG: Hint domain-containing protein [Rhodobacterales bacterium]|nr:Hint domain-containing protein [Rhodobacterales bacterium]
MAEYGIYIQNKAQVIVSGDKSLDGITQGDGSHLVGETITLGASPWNRIAVHDNDTAFQDNDCTQVLDGAQIVDGVTYVGGTKVEAEYSFTVTDGDQTWTMVAFNVNNSPVACSTIEGVAVLGGPGGFPPSGVPLTVTQAFEGPNFQASSYATPICFVSGMRIDRPGGTVAVEDLRAGDCVRTLHEGRARLRWCGARICRATQDTAPIRFAPGVLGNDAALLVSPQHHILVSRPMAALLFCAADVLVPAKAFVNGRTVTQQVGGMVRYHHLLFDRHQIVVSDGVASESFLPGASSLASLTCQARDEVLALFPRLRSTPGAYGPAAAPMLRTFEARALLAA